MPTLNKEQELVNIFVEAIDNATDDEVKVIFAKDYTEKRPNRIVVVGISSCEPSHPQNPMLPDYDYTVEVLVDCFIDNDKGGAKFEQTKNEVLNFLETYFRNQSLLPELFTDFPVVGMFFIGMSEATTEKSNQARIAMRVVASFDEN